MRWILLVFPLLWAVVDALCATYSTSCVLPIGSIYSDSNSGVLHLQTGEKAYFSLENAAHGESEIKLLKSYGNIKAYVAYNREATLTDYDYISSGYDDIIGPFNNNAATAQTISILLVALTESHCRILATSPTTPTQLPLNVPLLDSTSTSRSYIFTPTTTDMLLVATSPYTSSDPDLRIVGPGGPGVAREWTSNAVGGDAISFIPTTTEIGHQFTITVTARNVTIYTISATTSSLTAPTQLLGGYPLIDSVPTSGHRYYQLALPAALTDTVVTVTSRYGDSDLYVNPASVGFYSHGGGAAVWSSELSFGADTVLISRSDTQRPNIIDVTVYGQQESQFVISAYSASTVITLSSAVSIVDTVSAGSYHYYRYLDTNAQSDIIFNVVPINGDPDLQVACRVLPTGDDEGYPSRISGHYNFSAQRSGEDNILIPVDDPRNCKSGVFYLSVYAYSEAKFSLHAYHQSSTLSLQAGVPVQSTAYRGIGMHYIVRLGTNPQQLTIALTPDSGDIDLFVRFNAVASPAYNDYRSISNGASAERIVIEETDICTRCWVSVYVFGYQTSTYTLVASLEDTTLQLSDAVPLSEAVGAHKIQYYALETQVSGAVQVVLTVFSGAPILYLSTTATNPTANTEDTTTNNAALSGNIPVSTLPIRAGQVLYVGVAGHDTNSTFAVRANVIVTNQPSLLHLLQGVPQNDQLDSEHPWKYYQINVQPGHEDISIRLTSLVGNADVYVSRCPHQSYECAGTHGSDSSLPALDKYIATTAGEAHDWLTVTRSDDEPCSYIIGVYSTNMFAEYQMSFSFVNSILQLQPGVAVMDHVDAGTYDYFSFAVNSDLNQAIRFTVTPLSGDADIYISTAISHPNASSYMWKSDDFGSDTVAIETDKDITACVGCTYFVSVYGFGDATYSLVAQTESTIGRIVDGVPISDHVDLFKWNYYTFTNHYGIGKDLKITSTPSSGDPDLYITLDGSQPTWLHFAYHSGSWSAATDIINIKHTDAQYAPCLATECHIRIGVFGFLASDYVLQVTSANSHTLLQTNVPFSGAVALDTSDYFKVLLNSPDYTIRISLTEYSGHTAMYISCKNEFPDSQRPNTYAWKMVPATMAYLEVSSLEAADKGCAVNTAPVFYMTVYGVTSATYSVLITLQSTETQAIRLTPGATIVDNIAYHSFDYYFMTPSSYYQDIQITATVTQGDVDLYISADWESHPTYSTTEHKVVSFVQSSNSIGGENMILRHTLVQDMCGVREGCYIIIAVFGVSDNPQGSNYRLIATMEDSTITLSSGVPVRNQLHSAGYDYYKYTITAPDTDVMVTLTSYYGDPDLYIAMAPIRHPSNHNFTWVSAYFGRDSMTLQAADLATYCKPDPAAGKNCDLYIAVYSWYNSSYSIEAHMDEGFANAVTLLDGQPQSGYASFGGYNYYQFYITGSNDNDVLRVVDSVRFTLTPTGNGDQDIFITFDGTEPGRSQYQYKSSNFASIAEDLVVSAGMPHFCVNCMVNVAVYGYTDGSFTISASTGGVTQLQTGVAAAGHLEEGAYRYYALHNIEPLAVVDITLTPITGDADLYVVTYKSTDSLSDFQFPTKTHYYWRSVHAGSDHLSITYESAKFCFDCDYVIAVHAYSNSTYTLMVTNKEAAVINLVANRPQYVATHAENAIKYFRIESTSSTEDVTFSVTKLGSGTAVMYVQSYLLSSYNGTLPDPSDARSYSYTTLHNGDDTIFIPGPHYNVLVYVVAVKTALPLSFNMLMSSSIRSVILTAGIPQSHYVKQGATQVFRYYLSEITDLQVSLTATAGDPDLIVSAGNPHPACVMGDTYYHINCYNYTWSSASYSNDQIVISKDFPCKAVLPTTLIHDCKPELYHTGESVYIGVYGYMSSRFTILATPRGQHVKLLPGKPQSSTTALGYICALRNNNGACTGTLSQQVQIGYFSFTVNPPSSEEESSSGDVVLSVQPYCNVTRSMAPNCMPGCDCNPLKLFVKSCAQSKCTTKSMFPSSYDGQYDITMSITSSANTVAITKRDAGHCNPTDAGEPCIYYVSVLTHNTEAAQFSVTARTPGDVALIPCDAHPSPDRTRLTSLEVTSTKAKYYELCSVYGSDVVSSEKMIVQLEQCFGSTKLYACSDGDACESVLPTSTSWAYFADHEKSCFRSTKSTQAPTCDAIANHRPTISLPEKNGNYHLMVDGSNARYYLDITRTHGGYVSAPLLMFPGRDLIAPHVKPSISGQVSESTTLSWETIRVLMPGAGEPSGTSDILYMAYVINKDEYLNIPTASSYVLTTVCGLQYLAASTTAVRINSIVTTNGNAESVQHTINDLDLGTEYMIVVTATCDGDCLRQLSKVTPKATLSCAGDVSCKSQTYVYDMVTIKTPAKPHSNDDDVEAQADAINTVVIVTSIILSIIIVAVVLLWAYYYQNKKDVEQELNMEMTDFRSDTSSPVSSRRRSDSDEGEAPTQRIKTKIARYVPPVLGGAKYSPVRDEEEEVTINL